MSRGPGRGLVWPTVVQTEEYAEALYDARSGLPGADWLLRENSADAGQPAISRATALGELGAHADNGALALIR